MLSNIMSKKNIMDYNKIYADQYTVNTMFTIHTVYYTYCTLYILYTIHTV